MGGRRSEHILDRAGDQCEDPVPDVTDHLAERFGQQAVVLLDGWLGCGGTVRFVRPSGVAITRVDHWWWRSPRGAVSQASPGSSPGFAPMAYGKFYDHRKNYSSEFD